MTYPQADGHKNGRYRPILRYIGLYVPQTDCLHFDKALKRTRKIKDVHGALSHFYFQSALTELKSLTLLHHLGLLLHSSSSALTTSHGPRTVWTMAKVIPQLRVTVNAAFLSQTFWKRLSSRGGDDNYRRQPTPYCPLCPLNLVRIHWPHLDQCQPAQDEPPSILSPYSKYQDVSATVPS